MAVPVVDSEGRVFGRINLVDALVVAFVLGLVPLSYAAYRVFRIPPPIIRTVEPAVLAPDSDRRIRLTGERFIPYLRAFFWKTGEPLSVVGRFPSDTQGRFLVESPMSVEIKVPPELVPGTYDIYLFDETKEVAHRAAAFTITAPWVEDGVFDVRARFVVSPEMAPLVRTGQLDVVNDPGSTQKGRLVAVEVRQEPASQIELTMMQDEPRYFGSVERAVVLIATVRVDARRVDGVPLYHTSPLRAGERLRFRTNEYLMRGTVLGVTKVTDGGKP